MGNKNLIVNKPEPNGILKRGDLFALFVEW